MDWVEIRDMLGLDISPDQLRKQAVGYEEYDNYINGYAGVATTILSISDLHYTCHGSPWLYFCMVYFEADCQSDFRAGRAF